MVLTVLIPQKSLADKVPLMVEAPVDPALSPYLVTSWDSVVWIERSHEGHVRSAVQPTSLGVQFSKMLLAVKARGMEDEWGNVQPLDVVGLRRGVEYLADYGFTEVDYLSSLGSVAPTLPGLTPAEVAWVPAGCAVLIPKDREFVGVTLDFGNRYASILHNAARGIVVLVA